MSVRWHFCRISRNNIWDLITRAHKCEFMDDNNRILRHSKYQRNEKIGTADGEARVCEAAEGIDL